MSDTPRTDQMEQRAYWFDDDMTPVCESRFVRPLELELNEANKTIRLQHELMMTAEKRGVDKAKEELNAANERIKRLEEEVDALMEIVEGVRSERWNVNGFRMKDTPEWVQFYVSFRKAKRSKRKEAKP